MALHEISEPPLLRPAAFRQAGILVKDGSPSMLDHVDSPDFVGTKGSAVAFATSGLLTRFAVSGKAANFSFAGIVFADSVVHKWGPVQAASADTSVDYDPTLHKGNGTSLAAGLVEAKAMTDGFLAEQVDGLPSSVVVLLLSDGECQTPDKTRAAAAALTVDPRVTLACAYFATKGQPTHGLGLLQQICSQPSQRFCKTVYDAETLRKFWEASMTAVAALPAGSSSVQR